MALPEEFHSLTRLDGVYCIVSPKGEVLSMHLTLKEADEAGAKINGPIQIEMGKWT
jgi:hypothetical protein